MYGTLSTYASGIASKATDTYGHYMAKDDIDKLLVELTANENWNVANSKLLQVSDATYDMGKQSKIADHLLLKLQCKGVEWRRILKSLNAIEFMIKSGSPSIVSKFQMDVYKIRSMSSFSFDE